MNPLFDQISRERELPAISYPTATLFDLQVGSFKQGFDGKFYCTGGLTRGVSGVIGGPSTYKSTIMGSLVMRALHIHKGTSAIIHDAEVSFIRDLDRVDRLADEFMRMEGRIPDDFVTYLDDSDTLTDNEDVVNKMCANKEAHRKDFIAESPFIDKTGKRVRMWIPTYLVIDTYTNVASADARELVGKGIANSGLNMIYMKDGGKKSVYLPQLNYLANKYGICVILTAHVGKQSNLDGNPNVPPPKELQYMRQGESIKQVGSQFDRLTNPLIQTMSAKKLIASDGKPEYNYKNTTPLEDLNEVAVKVLRNKSGSSGTIVPYVLSQQDGLLNTLTNYHYLRSNKYYGLNGNMQRHQAAFMPDVTLTRNSIRELTESNAELRRALEISAQYLYIVSNYNTAALPYDFTLTPTQIFDKLNAKSKELVPRILNSRSYWTASVDNKDKQEYFSIFDILELVKD